MRIFVAILFTLFIYAVAANESAGPLNSPPDQQNGADADPFSELRKPATAGGAPFYEGLPAEPVKEKGYDSGSKRPTTVKSSYGGGADSAINYRTVPSRDVNLVKVVDSSNVVQRPDKIRVNPEFVKRPIYSLQHVAPLHPVGALQPLVPLHHVAPLIVPHSYSYYYQQHPTYIVPALDDLTYYGYGYRHPLHLYHSYRPYSAAGPVVLPPPAPKATPEPTSTLPRRPSNYQPGANDLDAQEARSTTSKSAIIY